MEKKPEKLEKEPWQEWRTEEYPEGSYGAIELAKLQEGGTDPSLLELEAEPVSHEYISPTYLRLGPTKVQQGYTVICAFCPASTWQVNARKGIKIYCSFLRGILALSDLEWGERATYLLACDHQKLALAEWKEERREQEEANRREENRSGN